MNFQERNWLSRANTIADEFRADAVLAVMFNNGLRATRLTPRRPLWVDLYGDRLTENQIAAHTWKSKGQYTTYCPEFSC